MSSKLNRHAYEALIEEDVAALLKHMPDTLERTHIEALLRDSARMYYDVEARAVSPEVTPTALSRYDIFAYWDGFGDDISAHWESEPSASGEWVRWSDVERLSQPQPRQEPE